MAVIEPSSDDLPIDEIRELLEESGRKKDNPILALGAALVIAQAEIARLRKVLEAFAVLVPDGDKALQEAYYEAVNRR